MSTVYVLNKDGKPLMPTTRGGHVRHLLKEQKARVVRAKPFTIQLLCQQPRLNRFAGYRRGLRGNP